MKPKLADALPPLIAGSLVAAAAILTLFPFVRGLAEAVGDASPRFGTRENPRPAEVAPKPETTAPPDDDPRSNRNPQFEDRKEITV